MRQLVGVEDRSHRDGDALANRLREAAAFRDDLARAAFGISGEEFAADARQRLAPA